MGQSNNKYCRYIPSGIKLVIGDPKLIIKESSIVGAGMGCFAGEFIPKGTIFCRADPHDVNENVDSRFINDLLYDGDAQKYSNMTESETVTNIGYISVGDQFSEITHVYCEALNDISTGEELSRYYGPNYWYHHEFLQKYGTYLEKGEIPPVYIFFDRYSGSPIMNRGTNVFVKYIDGKYFYVSGTIEPTFAYRIKEFETIPVFTDQQSADNYKDKTFATNEEKWDFKYLIDVSKSDNSAYILSETIDGDHPDAYWDTPEGNEIRERINNELIKKYEMFSLRDNLDKNEEELCK